MSQALSNLLALLDLEKLRKGCFAGRAKTGVTSGFGGRSGSGAVCGKRDRAR